MKFGRYYEIRIKTPDGYLITIKPPITAVIEVQRDMRAAVNNANLTIYNLAPDTRGRIYKDLYNTLQRWQMSIVAGYGETELYEIFRGNIEEAYSLKQNTDLVTTIKAYDGSYQIKAGFANETIEKGVDLKGQIERVIHTMPEMLTGVLGGPAQGNGGPRGKVLTGNSYDVVQELTDNHAFIDGETLYVLGDDEVLSGDAFVLSGENLFSTPKRRDTYLEAEAQFSPEIRIGHFCELKSTDPRYDGQYQVYGLKHAVTFGDGMAGDAITTVSLNAGARRFSEVSE